MSRASSHLARGEQHEAAYRALNPQGLVPMLVHGNRVLTQSLAILEYLDEVFPTPPLLPRAPELRARARAIAGLVACDIHPLNNLRVLRFLEQELGQGPEARGRWYRHWIQEGFRALETMLGETIPVPMRERVPTVSARARRSPMSASSPRSIMPAVSVAISVISRTSRRSRHIV